MKDIPSHQLDPEKGYIVREIENIKDIQLLARQGFNDWQELGFVSVKPRSDLRIFNYTARAQYEYRWNYFEQVSRGLILNSQTGEIVARSFDKFFNWGEGDRFSTSKIRTVTEKMDGSLGILYRESSKFRIATRGSFESDQAIWATEFLQGNFDLAGLPVEMTLLFEIIYPGNRIVVDYQGREDLVLLGIRNRVTGQYYTRQAVKVIANAAGFSLPTLYQFETTEQINIALKELDGNSEGWVVVFEDGQRFKFKGEEYFRLHKLISGLSFKNTLECVANGSLDELRQLVPDEFLSEVNKWVQEIQETAKKVKQAVGQAFDEAPKETRKEFALWVMAHHKPLASYMFARLDNKPIDQLIYKMAFKDFTPGING